MIKVSLLQSTLHESNKFNEENEAFIKQIEKELKEEIVVSDIRDYDCDLKLIFIASGGSEGLFLENIDSLQEPYFLLTSGENNSLAASLEIMTYLNINNLEGEVLHGDAKYIASRITELKKKEEKYEYLGVIGNPSDWLIASIPKSKVLSKFHVSLVDISLFEVIDLFNKIKQKDDYKTDYFNNDEINKADKMYYALKEIIKKYHLSGFTIRCFDLLSEIKTTGCLALAKLNDEGIIATCEGDVMAMVSMYLVKKHFNIPSFQANPARIDPVENKITLCHCTLPLNMTSSYRFMTHFESKIGVGVKGELFTQDVTILRISKNMEDFFVGEGRIIRNLNEENLCRTQIEVAMNDDIGVLLRRPCGNHHIVFYGHYKDRIIEILKNGLND